MHRVFYLLVLAAAISGCAGPRDPVKNQIALNDIVWREPGPAEAVVYLLRAPHDKSVIVPIIDDAPVQRLEVDTYIALPNRDGLGGAVGGVVGASLVGGPLGLIGTLGAAAFKASSRKEPDGYGAHRWVECTDLDARGLASFSAELNTGDVKATAEAAAAAARK
jgi:hypothetical protein